MSWRGREEEEEEEVPGAGFLRKSPSIYHLLALPGALWGEGLTQGLAARLGFVSTRASSQVLDTAVETGARREKRDPS